jgi:hypothetical protein
MGIQANDSAAIIASYANTTRFASRHVALLATKLARFAPDDLRPEQRAALEVVMLRANDVGDIQIARARNPGQSVRVPRYELGTAWVSLATALGALVTLPPELGPEGAEAQTLLERVFRAGTGFTQLEAAGLWGDSSTLLARIEQEALAPRIDALVAPGLLRNVRRTFERLGVALGIRGEVVVTVKRRALAEACARFSYAVASYARALSVGVDDDDEVALRRFAAALAPIDEHRVTSKPAREEGDEDVREEAPNDEVDPEPVAGPSPSSDEDA